MEHSDLIANFCGITGAAHHVAEHYLAAHEWDLNRSIDFYLEHPPAPDAAADEADEGPPPLQRQPEPVPMEMEDEDEELRRALAASMQTGPAAAHPVSHPTSFEIADEDDEDVQVLASHRSQAMAARRQAEETVDDMLGTARQLLPRMPMGPAGFPDPEDFFGITGRGIGPQLPAGPSRQNYPAQDPSSPTTALAAAQFQAQAAAAAAAAAAAQYQDEDEEVYHDAVDPYQRRHQPRHPPRRPPLQELPDLPEGINLEEARMLEAALLGVPYQGRVPDFRGAPAPEPVAPEVQQQRLLRREQDWEYEEGLRLDREKHQAAERAAQEAERARQQEEEQQRQQQLAEEAEQRRKQEEEQRLRSSISRKEQSLAPEPLPSDPDYAQSFSIAVRLPDGSRKGRRFRPSDPLHSVFDYVDVASQGQGLKPHSYRLVTQFPRRVFTEGQGGSLVENGVSSDQAMFIEML